MKKSTAMLYSLGSMLCWAVSPILIRYVMDYFTISFQNFFRFAVSILILWLFTFFTMGRKRIFEAVRNISNPVPKFLCIALCNFAHQFFLIKGVYFLLPGIVSIVQESTIIFSVTLAFIFIPEERDVIGNPTFIIGLLLAVSGVIMTAMPEVSAAFKGGETASAIGILCVLIASISWALFSLLIRLWFPSTPAPVISSLVFTMVVPFFLISMIVSGNPGLLLPEVPLRIWGLLSVSGLIGIGLGYSFYYQAIKGLGVTTTSSLGLIIPLISTLTSFLIFGERLNIMQSIGTAGLLFGCFMIIRARFGIKKH